MTYIEFFDKTYIENICTSLTKPISRVILIGDNHKVMQKQADIYSEIMRNRGSDVEFLCETVNKNEMEDVINKLSDIVEKYEDCVFDLTGGDETFLVATGIIFERYKDKNIQMHRINIRNNTIYDCDLDGKTLDSAEIPEITIEENIQIYGGKVLFEHNKPGTTPLWDITKEFTDDLNSMWEVCRKNIKTWNVQIGAFSLAEQLKGPEQDELTTKIPLEKLKKHKGNFAYIYKIINDLNKKRIIRASKNDEDFTITYKNEQVKKCLTKSGQVLEMKIYLTALNAQEKNNSKTYNDVLNGVCISWNNRNDNCNSENEVDIMMMHGMVPVFVSCKNGKFDINELYKLNTVATHFGGKYAKKVIVSTDFNNLDFSEYIKERAKEMEVLIVNDIQELDEKSLRKKIQLFWKY